jgi:hypothetical protein
LPAANTDGLRVHVARQTITARAYRVRVGSLALREADSALYAVAGARASSNGSLPPTAAAHEDRESHKIRRDDHGDDFHGEHTPVGDVELDEVPAS